MIPIRTELIRKGETVLRKTILALLVLPLLLVLNACGQPSAQDATPAPTEAASLGQTSLGASQPGDGESGSYTNLNTLSEGLASAAPANATFVGYGYDILNQSYVHMEGFSKSRPILKESEVQKRLLTSDAPAQSSHTMMGQTMKTYCNSFSSEMELKSSYPLFSGKITSEFDSSKSTTTNTYFIKSLSFYPTYQEYIKVTPDLKDILDDSFEKDLNGDMSPEELFRTYGTHLVVEDLMGGRCEFNYTYSSSQGESQTKIMGKVEATYRFISGSGSVEDKTTATSFLENSSFTSSLYGGKKIDASTLDNLIKNQGEWIKSIDKSTSTICGISNMNSLKPIWEFASSSARAQELKAYFDNEGGSIQKFIDSMSVIPDPTTPPSVYIQSIRVLSDKHKDSAKAQLYSGYTLIEKDLNTGAGGDYIYISYDTTTDPAKALKDIRVSFNGYGMPGAYTKNPHDLNKGAGGSYIYIWTTTNSSYGKPIKAIDVFYGKNADMPTGFTVVDYDRSGQAADLNHHAGGDYIYLGIKR